MPTALFVGEKDELATVIDNNWLENSLGENSIEHDDIKGEGHMTFLLGKDESYLNDVIALIEKYKWVIDSELTSLFLPLCLLV